MHNMEGRMNVFGSGSDEFDLAPSHELLLDDEGFGESKKLEMDFAADDDTAEDEKQNHFDDSAVLRQTSLANRGMHMMREPSNRTVSSLSSVGEAPPLATNDSKRSMRSNSSEMDESAYNGSPRQSRNLTKELSARSFMSKSMASMRDSSPRARKYGRNSMSRRAVNLSTIEEESAALMELYSIIGEENRDRLELKRNPAGFIIYLELIDTPIEGVVPECICMFTQLVVLVVMRCGVSGPFPFWVDSLAFLQELNLSGNHLVGPIPDSISNLSVLQELVLSENAFSGPLPESLQELTALTKLELHKNDLSGIISENLCNLPALSELNLSSCYFSGHIPNHIGKLANLSVLRLQGNHLVGPIPESIGDLMLLEDLDLSSNHLKGRLPESIGRLHMLASFSVFHNELNGNIPHAIGQMASLTSLNLACNHFRGPIPESLCSLTMLTTLNLTKNQLSGQIPASLERLVMLTSLNMSFNRLKGSIPEGIGCLVQLTDLHLDHNSLSGELPVEIGQLTALQVLTITQNQLTGEIPESVGNLLAITILHLNDNQLSGMIPETIGSLTCLQHLNLSHNQLIGCIPEGIVNLTALTDLDLSFNRLSGAIPDGIVNLTQLVEVNLIDTYMSGYDIKKGIFLMSSCGIWATDQYGQRGISAVNFADWNPSFYQNAPLQRKEHRKFQIPMSLISLFPHTLFQFPPELLRKIFLDASFYSHIRTPIFAFLKKVCEAQNPCILQCLVVLWHLLNAASKVHISEEADLLEFANEVVKITSELFKCTSMDKLKNVQRLILEPRYCQPIQKNLDGTFDSVTYWNMAHIFADNSPIQFCLEHNHKFVLALTQITNITDQLFWGCINTIPNGGEEEPRTIFEFSNTEFHTLTTYKLFACPRYTPAIMFFIEGLSKLYTLALVSLVCFTTYGSQSADSYSNSAEENLLLMMLVAQTLYELGQLASCGWSLKDYFGGIWNILDVACCALLMIWAFLLPNRELFYLGKVAIAMSAIPLALVQLQYLSLIKTLGLLVLMIQSMMVDVSVFIVVYLVSIYGFTVCFRALFYTVNGFSSTGIAFVTLFQSTDDFDGTYKMVGIVVMVIFLTLTNVLLVNLLIAQMSSTYNRIIFKSREEWTFIKASYVQDNMLLQENNPFCMLPPPLNLITIFVYPLHVWALDRYNISVAGTVSDYVLGFYLIVPRFIFYWWKRVQAVFIDAEEEDEEFQEPYHAIIHLLIWCMGKRLTRLLVLAAGMPFAFVYVVISSVLRIFFVTVRVKPLDEDSEGCYELNFYLDGDDDDEEEETGKEGTTAASKEGSGGGGSGDKPQDPALGRRPSGLFGRRTSSNLSAQKSISSALKVLRQASSKSGKDVNEGAYTFDDAKPDAFGVVPDDHEDDAEPKAKPESKGAKRLKKAYNKKASFVIDPDIYNDPSAAAISAPSPGKRVINKSPPQKFTAKLSFTTKAPNNQIANEVTTPAGGPLSPNDGSGNTGGGIGGGVFRRLSSPLNSFTLNDGSASKDKDALSPKTSFNSNDGAASKITPKLSFNGLDTFLNIPLLKKAPTPPPADGTSPPSSARDTDREEKGGKEKKGSKGGSKLGGGMRAAGLVGKLLHRNQQRHPHADHDPSAAVNALRDEEDDDPPEAGKKSLSKTGVAELDAAAEHVGKGISKVVDGGVMAVNFANKLMHKVKLPKSKRHDGAEGEGHEDSDDGSDEEGSGHEGDGLLKEKKSKDLNPLTMFMPHKKRAPKGVFQLPEESEGEGRPRKEGTMHAPSRSASGSGKHASQAPPTPHPNAAKRAHSRRMSKQSSTGSQRRDSADADGCGSSCDEAERAGHAVDAEGYRLEEGDGSDYDDEDYDAFEDDYDEEDAEEAEEEAEALNTKQLKSNILFTPDDIIRMFPANENEMAKLEIEDEIRKLKVSSEAAVQTATEEMKADFKAKINQAVAEIRNLKDAIISSRIDKLPLGKSFSLADGKTGESPLVSARKLPGESPLVASRKTPSPSVGGHVRKKGSFFQPIVEKQIAQTANQTPSFANTVTAAMDANAQGQLAGVTAPPPAPVSMPEAIPTSVAAPAAQAASASAAPVVVSAAAAQEMEQMQQELQDLKGDMKDIKKLLGNILVKMK